MSLSSAAEANSRNLKVMTILGTRPEIIRLSRVMAALDEYTDHVIVHTGQNYDYELSEVFFEDLQVRRPDHFLGVDTSSLGAALGGILKASEAVMLEEQPDAVLILGDTNSALSAIMARRLKIPVYHMEAGNRSFDHNVPEETNRRIVDHVADFNLAYTEHARRHLLAEGLPHRRIYVTGSPMREVLEFNRASIEASDVLKRLDLNSQKYFIVSLHREENVDNRERLRKLLKTLNALANKYGYPVIVSTHPRTRKRIDSLGGDKWSPLIRFLAPLGFHDYNRLQLSSFCAISDSGTIAEEASILGFPAITPRDSIERPEGLDVGALIMTGLDQEAILRAIEVVTSQFKSVAAAGREWPIPADYEVRNTSHRVVSLIVGTAQLSNTWDGIRHN